MWMLGMLAGALSAWAALYYTLVLSDASLGFAGARVLRRCRITTCSALPQSILAPVAAILCARHKPAGFLRRPVRLQGIPARSPFVVM